MMFKNDFVAVVKAGGKILREDGSDVYVPFGSEYSVMLKNLRAQTALVSVHIDGEDVLGGRQLLVRANGTLDLERFLKDGNMDSGNRFRFIQKTAKIQDHRGDRVDDGIVRVEFQFEKLIEPWLGPVYTYGSHGGTPKGGSVYRSGIGGSSASDYDRERGLSASLNSTFGGAQIQSFNSTADSFTASLPVNSTADSFTASLPKTEEGITVAGSQSGQKFTLGRIGQLEPQKYVIALRLLGETASGAVEKPVTARSKVECPTCGTKNTSRNKFCSDCGTALR